MLDQLRESLQLTAVALQQRENEQAPWRDLSSSGPVSGSDEAHVVPISTLLRLHLWGRPVSAADLRLASAVGQQADAVLERDRLRAEARASKAERERGVMRTALLAAVSHDLRTPLAAIKAGVSALRTMRGIPEPDREALLADVDHHTDRLQLLIDNLLDMSRLDSGAVTPRLEPVALDEIVPRAVDSVPEGAVEIDVPETLPLIRADAGLLERALANVIENAVRYSPDGNGVRVSAQCVGQDLVIRVVDHGPGVADVRKDQMFAAFQRLGDAPSGRGVGLGLAVARGFVEANGGRIEAEDTPGGGLTMVITLPLTEVPG